MIRKISKFIGIGKFTAINQKKDFQFGDRGHNCNIIFGFNGSGKTTLSNAISFFSHNSFISEDEKKEIFNDIKNGDESVVELDIIAGSMIKYPASSIHSKSIYVFNSSFVAAHIFNGTKAKIRKFANIGGEIKNKEIDKINEQIDKLNEEMTRLEEKNKVFDAKHNELTKAKSKTFGKMLTDKGKRLQTQDLFKTALPKENIQSLETKLSTLSVDYDLSKKQSELNADLEEIRQISFGSIDLDFKKIDGLLSKSIQQLSKEVLETKIKEVQDIFLDEEHKRLVEKWFGFGKEILEALKGRDKKYCPICNRDISDKLTAILKEYQQYFDESYENFITELKELDGDIAANIGSLEQIEINAGKLEKIKIKYERLLSAYNFDKYDFANIKADLRELKSSIQAKNDNIQNSLSKPQTIESNIASLNSTLNLFETLRNDIRSILESKKLNTNTIEDQIRQTCNEIIILEFNQLDSEGALEKYKDNKKRILTITEDKEEGLIFWKNRLSEELKKIKAESKCIAKYLNKMGIDHIDIEINEEKQEENIVIRYKESGNERNQFKNCLSDGEKTALAFAYFLSKFENEINTEARVNEAVVVIDDPICSLDENRLYSTANLIWHNFENVKQLIVMSHNFLFLKYFNSFYRNKANCLFVNRNEILELPPELKNFETPYFYMLKCIVEFLDPGNQYVNYSEAKRYLPNFIRRVLETFLSFKFAKTLSRPGAYRSPGLEEFDENIDSTNMEISVKKELKEKIAEIKSITDAHSHGNAHHTQESFYISETDLKTLAQHAIDIIETMDNLHKISVMNGILPQQE